MADRIILAGALAIAVWALFLVAPSLGMAAVGGAGFVIVRYWLTER